MATPKDKTTEVALAAGTAVGEAFDYGEDAGAGFDGANRDDYLVPMLDVVQPNSGEMTGDGDFKAGQLIIRALGSAYDGKKGIAIIPVGRQHAYVQWRPKDQGGGIQAQFAPDDPIVAKVKELNGGAFGKLKMKGNPNDKTDDDLVETFYLYAIAGIYGEGADNFEIEETMPLSIPFSSTKIGAYKGLMTKASMIRLPNSSGVKVAAPLFAHRFRMTTKLVEKSGNKWFVPLIGFDGKDAAAARLDPRGSLYNDARDFAALVKSGEVKIDTKGATTDDSGGGTSGAASKSAAADDKEIPF
ncbi:MAG: hypothetical protein JWN75_1242 [Candidatus Saccharibacteria bacterium]|nr:hypothetical protein [Candidatus Saccharibacteria bacterium]